MNTDAVTLLHLCLLQRPPSVEGSALLSQLQQQLDALSSAYQRQQDQLAAVQRDSQAKDARLAVLQVYYMGLGVMREGMVLLGNRGSLQA